MFLLGLSLSLLFLAYTFNKNNNGNKIPFVTLTAWCLFFLASVSAMTSGIDVKTGDNITVLGSNILTSVTYTTYENHIGFFFLTIMSVIGFISVFFDLQVMRWN
jgi:formate hydrogenlyase subunit 3/multisubunit Na+/H+ antiporter MnhD subunit